ncbi:hypothetical protein ACSMX9_22665 [Streptomyces sp. LE64]|uniref:hypothetical protein n=1 Tax=Streptomyces sp. LE64 TaxID=3448653 RepID=UPI0040422C7E
MPTPSPPPARRAAVDLAALREQWGDLLAAIETPPPGEWPPRDSRALGAAPEPAEPGETIGRVPLTLREHPAPLNLTALDAAEQIESDLFEQADATAERVQHWPDIPDHPGRWHLPTVRTAPAPAGPILTGPDTRSARDRQAYAKHGRRPARRRPGHYADIISVASAGSRAHGLHWAAVWLEGVVLGENPECCAPPPDLVDRIAAVAAQCRRRLERTLGRDGRRLGVLPSPCPWCGGELTGRAYAGGEPLVTCGTWASCPAPAALEDGRRTWRGADLAALHQALAAADAA